MGVFEESPPFTTVVLIFFIILSVFYHFQESLDTRHCVSKLLHVYFHRNVVN